MNTKPLEADTRLLINNSLENLGWKLKKGKDQNVWFEQAKTVAEQKKLGGKHPDYVLYSEDCDIPLIVIEAKRPGERIDKALEQGIHYARVLNAPLVFATDGVFCKSFHTIGNTTPKLNGEYVDEFIREALALEFLAKWEVNTVSPKVQYDRKELVKIFDEANNMLRGDGLRAGIERFGEFANILFLKLISESEQIKKESGIPSKFDVSCSWDTIKNTMPSARIDYINSMVYKKLNALYGTEIFTSLIIRDNTILKEIMDKLDPLTLTDVDSDVKGDAFEYFLRASTATKNDLGEYFTPRHIVKTMVRLVNPQFGEKIYDPFCGTGGFLIETFRYIDDKMPRNPTNKKFLCENTIYGNEITNTARITKMNMILAGDGHSNIGMKDSLANPVNGKYDIVLANMPYSQKTKHSGLYDLPSTNGDSICVQHCMKAINAAADNGRMALVVPEGFLFRKDLAKTREYLLERAQLQSIISLPQGVFLPYTGVKTNIIFATKVNQKIKSTQKHKDYWYFEVKSDGLTLDNNRRKLDTPSDLTKYEEYRKLDCNQKDEMLQVGFEIIPLDKVRENSFVLVGSKYREPQIIRGKYTAVALGDILDYEQPTAYIVETIDYNDNFPTPVLTAGQTFILGYTNEEKGIFRSPLPVIIFDDFTTSIKLVDFPFKVKSSAMKILKADERKASVKYVYYAMQGLTFDSSIHKRYWIDEYSKLQIPLPPLSVQKQIVNEIEGYQQIVDGARTVVMGYKPKIQIKSSWGTRKLSALCEINTCSIDPAKVFGENTFTYIDISSIGNSTGKIDTNNRETGINAPSRARRAFKRGDILMSTVRPNLKAFGYVDFEPSGCVASTGFAVLSPTKIYGKYLYYMLFDDYIGDQLKNTMDKGMYPSVNKDDLEYLDIPLPPIETQKQIVSQIEAEQSLVEPSRRLIEIFTNKIQDRIKEIWG